MLEKTAKTNQTKNPTEAQSSVPGQSLVSKAESGSVTEKKAEEAKRTKAAENFLIISPNLLTGEKKELFYYKIISQTIVRVCQIGLLLFLVLGLIGVFILFRVKNQGKIYDKKLAAADLTKLNDLKKIKKEVDDLSALNTKIEQSLKKQYLWGDLLAKLPVITPQGVVLTIITTPLERPGWIKIVGIAKERDYFLKFKTELEKTGLFEKIESPLSNYVSPESLGFELNAQVKNWSPQWGEEAKKQKSPNPTLEQTKKLEEE